MRISMIVSACVALIAIAVTGCNIVTPVAYAIHGPEKVLPVYEPDPERTTVVFVDDPSSKLAQRRLRYSIADIASRRLLEKEVIADVIDSRPILNAATQERYGERLSITELGRSVGADIVIYAVVTDFAMSISEGAYVPTARMRVKIIDTALGQRVWPESEGGHLMEVRIRQRPDTTGALSVDDRLALEQELASKAGLGLAQLFYKHEITESVLGGR